MVSTVSRALLLIGLVAAPLFFAVDCTLPANRIVTDKAPRNANGTVEFSSDFFLITPKRIEPDLEV